LQSYVLARAPLALTATVLPAFAATLFLSAGLMFLVEPMVAKMVLPRLGGSPAVWSTCLVFFQAVLLLGYAYAHALARLLSRSAQILVHVRCIAPRARACLCEGVRSRSENRELVIRRRNNPEALKCKSSGGS
jgi:hypothetical protein